MLHRSMIDIYDQGRLSQLRTFAQFPPPKVRGMGMEWGTAPVSLGQNPQNKQQQHSPTHHPDHDPIFISIFHLPPSIASSLFKMCTWQFFCTTSLHGLFGLPLGLEPSTSIHFFSQSVSSFRNTCLYHHNLFCCSIKIISSIPSLSLSSLLGTLSFALTLHIHLTILISAR